MTHQDILDRKPTIDAQLCERRSAAEAWAAAENARNQIDCGRIGHLAAPDRSCQCLVCGAFLKALTRIAVD